MNLVTAALELAGKGLRVFPLIPGKKSPPDWMKGYPHRATDDMGELLAWWGEHPTCNVGVSTSHYKDGYLLVIDVDNKPGKPGSLTIAMLRAEGHEFPDTYTQYTPTGGEHLFYSTPFMCRNSVQELGQEFFGDRRGFSSVDTRGCGGLVVGAGSRNVKGVYTSNGLPIRPAPAWLAERFRYTGRTRSGDEIAELQLGETEQLDEQFAKDRAAGYLKKLPPVPDGSRNEELYRAACWVKDIGVPASDNRALMLEHWECIPALELHEIEKTVNNAYKYGQNARGTMAPETLFKAVDAKVSSPGAPVPVEGREPIRPPESDNEAAPAPDDSEEAESAGAGAQAVVDFLNKSYAFCTVGANSVVLWETSDHKARPQLRTLTIDTFRNKIAGEKLIQADGEKKERYKLWLYHNRRRSYDGLVFSPGKEVDSRFYNLWRGFAFEPTQPGEAVPSHWQRALDDYLLHAHDNVCRGSSLHFKWLIAWFAHMIQRPGEKCITALVLQGGKGVGKNALVERPGALLGTHFMGTSKRRFLVGQFNSHLENKLLFMLNEAFWSKDAAVEAVLKELISEPTTTIERKGLEPYDVDNFMRIVVMGNEDTLVPASFDERRWAVFKVGEGHKQKKEFFLNMRLAMEDGGYRLLLRYLLDYDLSGIDVNEAPNTEGLHEQKLGNLDPFHEWWHECLVEGRIASADFALPWQDQPNGKPFQVAKETIRCAFRRFRKERNLRMREPHEQIFGKRLKECLPSVDASQKREGANVYTFPNLVTARQEWDKFIKYPGRW